MYSLTESQNYINRLILTKIEEVIGGKQMESLMEKVLYKGAVEFKSRTYGADASLTEMLCKPWTPGLPSFGSGPSGPSLGTGLRPMRSTEIFTTRLDDIEPDLRLVEKFHPIDKGYKDPSYQDLYGIKGTNLSWMNKKTKL